MVRRRFAFALLIALVLPGIAFAGKGERLDYPLFVSVDYGRPEDGPQGWRKEMEGWLISSLEAERCYRSVRMLRAEELPEQYLLVAILVEKFEERQIYDVAQSTLLDPDEPREVQQAFTLSAEADFLVRFALMPEEVDLRQKEFRLVGTHRPSGLDDAQYEVRFQLAQGVLNSVRGMICKPSEKKLAKEIDKARAQRAGGGRSTH